MSEWLLSFVGTQAGSRLAIALVLLAAVSHALFGALQKGKHDPWLSRAAIDLSYGVMAAPFALFVVPWPEPHMWLIFAGMMIIHIVYKILQAMTYVRGAYTVVYPVVRGTGPFFAVVISGFLFGELFTLGQWLGLALLLTGIFGLALWNLRHTTLARETMVPALWLAVATGAFVAGYTTYDAYGIRATVDPFTFLAWFFMLDGLFMPLVMARRMIALPKAESIALLKRGIVGALVAFVSFGAVMVATRIDNVGEIAVLRETSTVFAALIGWLVLKERVGKVQFALMVLISIGAVVVVQAG